MYTIIKTLLLAALSFNSVSTLHAQQSTHPKPVVYLTFDDGPSADSATDDLLELLGRHGAHATFFVTGQRAKSAPGKIASILYAGHAIGNHSHTHAVLTGETIDGIKTEFKKASEAVLAAGGPPLTCYRAPFGLVNNAVLNVGRSLGMSLVKWSVDTRDWSPLVEQRLITRSLDAIEAGSVVLMHDGPTRRGKTVAALTEWLEVNASRYEFKALPECKPYGTSEVFANADEQEVDLPLEQESIQSLLEKLRSYRITLQVDEVEPDRAVPGFQERLSSNVY